MSKRKNKKFYFTPIQSLSIGFSGLSLIGAVILSLPISSASGESTSFLNALFTSTSAVTTTGLIVVDTGTYFNRFGQTVIMSLFQIGGLGYMVFISLAIFGFAGKLSLSNRILLRESINHPTKMDLMKFSKIIILATIVIEFIGVVLLTIYWSGFYPLGEALYSALFHSISAFTTAGFSIYSNSFMKFEGNIFFNIVIIVLLVLGAVGFFVLYDIASYIKNYKRKNRRLTVHTKIVIWLMMSLSFFAALLFYFLEGNTQVNSVSEKIITAIFQAFTASTTAGFNTINTGLMSAGSLFITVVLMFIGAGPGGTAGGIKLTTFGVLLISLYDQLTGKKNPAVLKRRISKGTVERATAITLLAVLWMIVAVLCLVISEGKQFLVVLFEVVSALGTVGLSAGITSSLTAFGKIIIIVTMLIGRVGPLGIGLSIIRQTQTTSFEYPEEEILVG